MGGERPIIEMLLGKALMKVDRLREADQRLQSAFNHLDDNSSKATVAHLRGLIALKAKTLEAAVLHFEDANNLDPQKSKYSESLEEARTSLEGLYFDRHIAAEKQSAVRQVREHAARLKKKAELASLKQKTETREDTNEFEPVNSLKAEDVNEMKRSGCGAIHLAALRGRVEEIANLLLKDKSCGTQLDNGRNTGKLCIILTVKIFLI